MTAAADWPSSSSHVYFLRIEQFAVNSESVQNPEGINARFRFNACRIPVSNTECTNVFKGLDLDPHSLLQIIRDNNKIECKFS